MRVSLWNADGDFRQWLEIADGPIPDILTIDDRPYVRFAPPEGGDPCPRYRFALGTASLHTRPVPIYCAKIFVHPLVFTAKSFRMFSGCHGVVAARYEKTVEVSWKEKISIHVAGLTAVRVNGVYCPELPRDAGASNEKAWQYDRALLALKFARSKLKAGQGFSVPVLRFSAVGIDEYGRMICDVSKYTAAKLGRPEEMILFTPLALASGLFEPSILVTE
jgi:hypothetical protein